MGMKYFRNLIPRTLALATLGTGALAWGAGARAADAAESLAVGYADLNLATVQGEHMLYLRIVRASYEVCRPYGRDVRDSADPLALHDCRRRVIADALTRLGRPTLTAALRAQQGGARSAGLVTVGAGG